MSTLANGEVLATFTWQVSVLERFCQELWTVDGDGVAMLLRAARGRVSGC